jgi:hypothetical protein
VKNEEWGMENGKSALRAANVKKSKKMKKVERFFSFLHLI